MWRWNGETAIVQPYWRKSPLYSNLPKINIKLILTVLMKFSSAINCSFFSPLHFNFSNSPAVFLLVILLYNFSKYCTYDNSLVLNFSQVSSSGGMRILSRYKMYGTLRVFCPGIVPFRVENISSSCHLYWMESFVPELQEMTTLMLFCKRTSR